MNLAGDIVCTCNKSETTFDKLEHQNGSISRNAYAKERVFCKKGDYGKTDIVKPIYVFRI